MTRAEIRRVRAVERSRCARVLLKHIRAQRGVCCDNCNCVGMLKALQELSGQQVTGRVGQVDGSRVT